MDSLTKKNEKSEEQRMRENAEYIADLKKKALKKNRDISKYIGCISKETAEKMLKHVENERNNW